ncbi:MAG: hypothetical protein H6689_01090 [Erysipelotrichaceae bacterium]|nr:hypothetical protein [Erysipelotrichaceae bacterium]
MSILWLNKDKKPGVATFTDKAITLNTSVIVALKDCTYVMIGIDDKEDEVIIKPISINDIERAKIDVNVLYKVSINRSYARITSKSVVEKVEQTFKNCDVFNKKFPTSYDEIKDLIHIYLNKEVGKDDQ